MNKRRVTVPEGFSQELEKVLKAYKYSSKPLLVSMELLKDSFFDVGAICEKLAGEDFKP